ncbi:MAG TPA: hypothetical protein DIS79_04655 [Bacteroidetes bacterium]|nr:hypothetical protein [Bacteroidota bacterium]HRK04448.1 hypothetical protein [Chlorobiota bacterium]
MTLLYVNAVIVAAPQMICGSSGDIIYLSVNSVGTLASLIGYSWVHNRTWKITYTFLYTLFAVPLAMYCSTELTVDEGCYIVLHLIVAMVVTAPLYAIEFVRKQRYR